VKLRIREGVFLYRERGMLDSNTYVLRDELTILIDPGLETYLAPKLKELQRDGLDPAEIDLIAITHLHPDHCGATAALRDLTGAKVALHPAQEEYREIMSEESRQYLGVGITKQFSAEIELGEQVNLGRHAVRIIHTPGHSPCSVCFYVQDERILVCGDLVFVQGVGRTDFPSGDFEALKSSIELVSKLETELLLPGHGPLLQGQSAVARNFEFIKAVYFNAVW
jgi:hydroxyacylglutathione hydrolase